MASHNRWRKSSGQYDGGMSFFRIILPYNLKEGKLRFPKKFIRRCGKCLPNPMVLRLPNGTMWAMKWTRCNDTVCLQEGWREFAEYLSLDLGHFLLFKYEGNSRKKNERDSHFHIMVFDKSTTEVDYPSNLTHESKYHNIDIDESDNESVVFLEEYVQSPKENQVEQDSTTPSFRLNQTLESKCGKKLKTLTKWEKERLVERAGTAFKTKHPYFMVPVQPSHVSNKFNLHIPWKFVEGHVDILQNHQYLIFEAPDGKASWQVKCYIFKLNSKPQLFLGWKKFAVDNHLEVGDVCIFVLVERSNSTYQIIIKRASHDYGNYIMSPGEVQVEGSSARRVTYKEKRTVVDEQGEVQVEGSTARRVTDKGKRKIVDEQGAGRVEGSTASRVTDKGKRKIVD